MIEVLVRVEKIHAVNMSAGFDEMIGDRNGASGPSNSARCHDRAGPDFRKNRKIGEDLFHFMENTFFVMSASAVPEFDPDDIAPGRLTRL